MTQPSSCTSGLGVTDLATGYAERPVLSGIDLDIAPGKTTAIVGANACGKSTLLRTLSRLLTPARGEVLLDGKSIHRLPARQLAQRLGLLSQSPIAPEGITVLDLVSRGRHPHQKLFQRWRHEDDSAVLEALNATDTASLAERRWMSSPAGSANASGSPWPSLNRPTSCCLMSRPPFSTSIIRWKCLTC